MLVLGYETHGHWTLNAITGFRFEQALLFPRRFGWTRRRASSSAVLYRDIWVPHRTAHRRAEARKHSRGSTSHPITVKEHACTYTRAQIMTSSRAFTLMLRSITTSYSARAQACTFVLPFENASTTDRLCLASVHPASGLHDLLASPISKSSASSFGKCGARSGYHNSRPKPPCGFTARGAHRPQPMPFGKPSIVPRPIDIGRSQHGSPPDFGLK